MKLKAAIRDNFTFSKDNLIMIREAEIFPKDILPEFNICEFWHPNMSWADFQKIRTDLKRKGLMKYVNKIEVNKWIKEQGLPAVPVIFASNDKDNFIDYIADRPSYVAKLSHMSQNNGLIIVKI